MLLTYQLRVIQYLCNSIINTKTMDDHKKESRRKKLENRSYKKHKYSDDDQRFVHQSKKAFKHKKQTIKEEELLDEIDEYDF